MSIQTLPGLILELTDGRERCSVYENLFETSDILSDTYMLSGRQSPELGGHSVYNRVFFQCFSRTFCPTFSPKTSDMVFKTSDMSGCPTTFHA